jgi:ABC-type multidrug transport system ATPase subunit
MSLAGLEGKGGTLVRDLSGGMKRKLTLIRSLLHDPDLLFLDELTTGLDPESRREFWDYIENLKAQGKTILLTTHYIEEASQLADDIILIHQGKLIERGPPTELRRKHVGLATITLSADPMQLQRALPDTDVKQLSDGKLRVTIGSLEDIPGIMDAIHSNHVAYDHLEVKLTTLEEVFLRLTGRRIRE